VASEGNFGWATAIAADVARGFGYLLIAAPSGCSSSTAL